MKIQLWCDDLMSRMPLESTWKGLGATMLKKNSDETPDCIVIDLAVRRALEHIARLRASHPDVDIVAYAAKFEPELFEAAKQAGASDLAARSSIVERVMRRMAKAMREA